MARTIDTNTTTLLAGASNDDTPEVSALKAQIAQMTALMTTNTPATSTTATSTTAGTARNGKRARANKNGKTTLPKAVLTEIVYLDIDMS